MFISVKQDSFNFVMFVFVILFIDKIVLMVVSERDIRTDSTGTCTSALLNNLPSSSYSASSVLNNDPQFGPQAAKLESIYKLTVSNTAWCPNHAVSDKLTEWLQVDFSSMKIIKNIFTLGRDAGNYGEYVAGYYFDYQRQDGTAWYRYQDDDHEKIMKGNDDIRNPTHHKFISPVIAKRIRIIPISSISTKVCLRFTLYGCDFKDGVVEYQIPRGNTLSYHPNPISLDDNRYEESILSNMTWLQGGMGKLMDNIIPGNLSDQMEIWKFFVAWDQTKLTNKYVELIFKFDLVRVFQSIVLYPMNIPSMKILPFSSLTIEMINNKVQHSSFLISEENLVTNKPIKVKIANQEAKLIKIKLFFKSRWMGLSEVIFNATEIYTDSTIKSTFSWVGLAPTVLSKKVPELSTKLIIPVTLISCFIGTLIAVIIITLIFFLWIRQRKRRRYKSKLCDYRSMLINDPTHLGNISTISGKKSLLYNPADSHIFGPNSSSTIGFRYIHPPCPDYRTHSISLSNEYEHIDSYWPKEPGGVDTLHKDSTKDKSERLKLLVSGSSDITNTGACGPVYCSSSTYSSYPYDLNIPVPDIISQNTFNDIFNTHVAKPLKGFIGSTISCSHLNSVSPLWIDSVLSRLCETGPSNLYAQKHVSEGAIGYITSGIVDNCEHGVIIADMKSNNVNIDLKYTFYKQCFATIKPDFSSHSNLLNIIGKCTNARLCPSILYGFPSQVNVVTFFHKLRQLPMSNDVTFSCNYVSQGSLLYLAKQLADALAFLGDAGIVHRDVSARNCSIGDRFHLILLDFAIGLEDFQDDYISFPSPECSNLNDNSSKSTTVQLPLLWMPWEAIILGNFTSQSDVWSFGVTLWEVFTECQLKPYSVSMTMSSQDPSVIIKNAMLIANNHHSCILPNGRTIDQITIVQDNDNHSDISKHVREIMHLCWQPNPLLRPNFQTLFSIISELTSDLRYVDEYGTLHRMIS